MPCKPDSMKVYADLNGWRVNGGTVPSDLVATGQIPDIVLLEQNRDSRDKTGTSRDKTGKAGTKWGQ